MKRTIPLLITAAGGLVLIVSFFVPMFQEWGEIAAVWFDILASIAFVLGGGNLLKVHLQRISDRVAGWGYSAVTVTAFLITLVCGLLKLGAHPSENTEFAGETFAHCPIELLPVARIPGTVPPRGDGAPLPKSVRRQFSADDGELRFRGWMTPQQRSELAGYQDTLEWQCTVEELYAAAQLPDELAGKVTYYPDHTALSVIGVLGEDDQAHLASLLGETPEAAKVIENLAAQSSIRTRVDVADVPEGFAIQPEATDRVHLEAGHLEVVGPMSAPLRNALASDWCDYDVARTLGPEARQQLLDQLNASGRSLNEAQREVLHQQLDAAWDASGLIFALETPPTPPEQQPTACELLAAREAGDDEMFEALLNPEAAPTPERTPLNAEQRQLVYEFTESTSMSVGELQVALEAAGPWETWQTAALESFLSAQPTQAEQYRDLGLALLTEGPLTADQRALLLDPFRQQFAWRQTIGKLFVASQGANKYSWSGDYNEQGTPFWWIYQYIFVPLLTTTFAMLAFYVASAAFRAFRAKNVEAILLLGTAFIILMGRTYLGYYVTAWLPDSLSGLKIDQLTVSIMEVFNTAGNRAIMIGIALGIASTSLKVLLGVDRSYLGSD